LTSSSELSNRTDVGCLGSLSTSVGVNFGIEYHNVYVLAGSQNMVQTAEADIVCPTVATENPDGLLGQVFLLSQNFLAQATASSCTLFKFCNQSLGSLCVCSAVFLGLHELSDSILGFSRGVLALSHLFELSNQALTD